MPSAPRRTDDGFSLVEVVVAMAVLALLAGSAAVALGATLRTAGDNGRRATAAGLAAGQVESARAQRAVDIPDGAVTRAVTAAGTPYTITQVANYVPSDATTSVCAAAGDQLAYKLVTVTVTWPGMGSTAPVRADTLRALGVGADGLDATKGSVAVLVEGAHSDPVAGTVLTLTPGGDTRTTGADGCAVFTGLAPGSYSVGVDQTGSVASTGLQAASTGSLVVSAGRVQRAVLYDDAARSQDVSLVPPTGYAVPTGLSLAAQGTYLAAQVLPACPGSSPTRTCSTGAPGTLQDLFPDTYAVWAGTCSDAQGDAPASFDATPAGGSGTTAAVPLAGVAVGLQAANGTPGTAQPVYAVHAPETAATLRTSCAAGEVVALGTAGGGASATSALPFGTWTLTTDPTAPAAGDPVVTLTTASPTASAVLVR